MVHRNTLPIQVSIFPFKSICGIWLTHSTEEIKTFNHTYQTIHTDHEYSSLDQSVADAAWDNYTVNGHVALSNSLATDRGWIIGAKMPGDAGKSIFVIDSYHQLHCLV